MSLLRERSNDSITVRLLKVDGMYPRRLLLERLRVRSPFKLAIDVGISPTKLLSERIIAVIKFDSLGYSISAFVSHY